MIHVRGTPAKSTPDGVYLRAGRTERSLFCFTDATSNDGVCNGRACDENPIRAMMSASSPAKASRTKRVSFSLSTFHFVDLSTEPLEGPDGNLARCSGVITLRR